MRRFPVALMADEILQGPTAHSRSRSTTAPTCSRSRSSKAVACSPRSVAAIADAAGIELYGGTMLEGAFSTVASAHLFAVSRTYSGSTELFGPLLITEEIVTQPLDYSDFELTVPDGPGLGIELDEDKVRRFTRDGLTKVAR